MEKMKIDKMMPCGWRVPSFFKCPDCPAFCYCSIVDTSKTYRDMYKEKCIAKKKG